MTDVAIIGGGPAGCKAAALLSRHADVTVIEEHMVPGEPVQCTGLISDDVMRMSGVKADVLNSLYGANVHFPGGGVMTARSGSRKAVLIDRSDLDRRMADAAADAGAVFRYGTRYISHSLSPGNAVVRTSDGTVMSRIVVGADGQGSAVARSLGDNAPREYVRGIQADVRNVADDQEMVDIFLGSDVAPGFFAWAIPFGDMTRVGLCSSGDIPPSEHLKILLKRTGLRDSEVVKKYSGRIPLGGRRTTYGERTLLIGDAAGQVKPVSGGGLHPAFVSAHALERTVDEALSSDDASASFLARYERRWRSEVGKELRNGYLLRRVFRRMDDRALDDIMRALDDERTRAVLDGIDIDRPSRVALPLMRNVPAAARCASAVMKGLVRR